jgi:hypothetical protein
MVLEAALWGTSYGMIVSAVLLVGYVLYGWMRG